MREAGIEVDVDDTITAERLEAVIGGYDAIVVRSRTKVRAPLLEKATCLKTIIRGGVGLDNIDVDYAESKGITVHNTAGASSNAVAELTLGYLLALVRQIPQATASMKAGRWEKKIFGKGSELQGKTLGLIGCGRIGSLLTSKALSLGMAVLYYRRSPVSVPGAEQVALDELLARSDFISLHVPYTSETHHIVGEEEFSKMKDGVYVINVGRGGTLDEKALHKAIVGGKVAGAALDVYEDESEERGKHILSLPQVIGSPHIGSGTAEAKSRVGEEIARIAIKSAGR
jgi:D-3-phosphoglycerate dehydrogenase